MYVVSPADDVDHVFALVVAPIDSPVARSPALPVLRIITVKGPTTLRCGAPQEKAKWREKDKQSWETRIRKKRHLSEQKIATECIHIVNRSVAQNGDSIFVRHASFVTNKKK